MCGRFSFTDTHGHERRRCRAGPRSAASCPWGSTAQAGLGTLTGVRLTEDMQRVVREQALGFVATVRADGTPALSPKGTTSVWDDEHLVFLHIHSEGTVANLATNPNVEVNVVDPIRRKGYRFAGHAETLSEGARFEEVLGRFERERGTDRRRVKAAVLIEVTAAHEVISPAYDDGSSEAAVAQRFFAHHRALYEATFPADGASEEVASRDGYEISTDRRRLDLDVVHGFLRGAYWSPGVPRNVVERAIEHSLCFGLYAPGGEQVGFARVVTDRAAIAYLADVFVLPVHRGRGLGVWLIETVLAHPDLQGLRRFELATADAHALYARFGFAPFRQPERQLVIERAADELYGQRA